MTTTADAFPLPRREGALWDDLARAMLFLLAVLAVATFRDYGVSTDEGVQHLYGKHLLAFYLSGFEDWSAFYFKDLYLYGGLFDLVTAVLVRVSPFAEYETRHLLCSLIGVLGIAGCWRMARLLGGPRAGLAAAVLLAISGVYYGAMFNNTKDVPFAAGMVWTLYYTTRIVLQLPRPKRSTVLKFGLTFGLTLSIRVGAVLAAFYLAAALALHLALAVRAVGPRVVLRDAGRTVLALLPAVPVAYAVMAVFWPWAVMSPLNPLEALRVVSRFPISIQTLFMGELVPSNDPPALYLPVYLAVKLPEILLAGAGMALAMAGAWVMRVGPRRWPEALPYAPLVLSALLPILLFMLMRPSIYNGIRHFLFLVPSMAVAAGIAIDRLWQWAERRGTVACGAAGAALAGLAGVYALHLVALHPNQYVYYNRFTGGVDGAAGRYELDYWGNSEHEALLELIALVVHENGGRPPQREYSLTVCGNTLAVNFYLPPWLKLVNGIEPDWRNPDFFMAFTQDKGCPPLIDGRTIISIGAEGTPLSIVKDRRPVGPNPLVD
ncbi:glycosyltransferase family 39 protein [Azospirillum sp. SYSU D00513]|uniref:glycosyltransferase family 39 protein n=1 Tax=Azospirillum sp. SYSU D00513 TaxID=2812561 RepID=UPI0032B489C2